MDKPTSLLKILGIGFGLAMVIGNSIGSGILRMPGTVASYISNPWMIIGLWVLGGVLSLIGALIYAEASTAYPYTGGPYVISEKVFGKQAGFTVGICDWILNIAGNASLAVVGAEFINSFGGVYLSNALVAGIIVLLLSAVQWCGIKSSSIIQQGLSLLKALGLLFLVVAFFVHGRVVNPVSDAMANTPPGTFFSAVILAFRAILFTYASWNGPIYFSEENTDPRKDLPRSLIYGVLLLSFIYIIVNVAVLYLLPVAEIARTPLAVAHGAYTVFGEAGKVVVTVISIIIVLSCLYAGVLYTPRILFGIARSGLFFPFAATLNKFQIPGLSLIVTTVLTLLFTSTGTFTFIISVFIFLYLFVDTSVYVAALYSRWKNKTELYFKAPAYPLPHLFMILINLALLVSVSIEDGLTGGYSLAIILGTVPLYYIFKMIVVQNAKADSGSL